MGIHGTMELAHQDTWRSNRTISHQNHKSRGLNPAFQPNGPNPPRPSTPIRIGTETWKSNGTARPNNKDKIDATAVGELDGKSTHLEEGGGVGDIVADEALRGDADLVLLDGRLVPRPLHPLVPVHLGRRRRRSSPSVLRGSTGFARRRGGCGGRGWGGCGGRG